MMREVQAIDPRTLSTWMSEGGVLLVDVRPPERHAEERIASAISIPLMALDRRALPELAGRRLVFHCQVGVASERAGRKVMDEGLECEIHHLAGGIKSWKGAGFATHGPSAGRMSLQRQVQIVSGALVLLGVLLGATVSPWLYAIAALVGAGTVYSGASGTCAMAHVLARLPYNAAPPA